MVEKDSHTANTAPTRAQSPATTQAATTAATKADDATQPIAARAAADTSAKDDASSKTRVLGAASGAAAATVTDASDQDPVASRRLAHGLSPETTNSTDAAELKRKEKEANAEERKRKAQRKHRAQIIRRTIIIILLLILIGIIVGFWLLRWGLHDDAASIQGKWRVQGTDTVIEINDEEIVLTDEVAYDYVLDPEAKTLAFTFGALTGNGRYRFSLDHNMLAIDDGDFDAMGTLMTDIPWTVDAVSRKLLGNEEKNPQLEAGDMVLERVS